MKILITGATGLIGQKLGLLLARQGHELHVVSRSASKARRDCPFPCVVHEGDLTKGPLQSADFPKRFDGVFHLMGEPVADGRWSAEKKSRLRSSRIDSTRFLLESLESVGTVIAASAIGIYGDRGDEEVTESSAPGEDFLATLCRDWETEILAFRSKGARTLSVRIGIVLSSEGGALDKMLTPLRAGIGGPLGGGRQWMSWIHEEDLVRIFAEAVTRSDWEGTLNAVAPQPARNAEMMTAVARRLSRPSIFPVPALGLRALFGEKAAILLASQKVRPEFLETSGFEFRFPTLDRALDDLLANLSRGEDVFIARQYVPRPREELFVFFVEAKNLEEITPPLLQFRIQGMDTPEIQEGTLIDYRLKIHGVPVSWKTRIESWRPPMQFVDNQLKGPYSLWHHTHRFEPLGPGTLMEDRVRYKLPLGYLGWLGGSALVAKDVQRIFAYRREVIDRLFPPQP